MRFSYTPEDLRRMPARPERSHKGSFGRVFVLGGSPGMAGAAIFAGTAAYRSGCGLVELFTAEENRIILQLGLPEAVLTLPQPGQTPEEALAEALSAHRPSALVIGPGLGQTEQALRLLTAALRAAEAPLVLDADGLNLLAAHPELWALVPKDSILTPHPAELSRLTGLPVSRILEDVPGVAEAFAREHHVICAAKDHRTAVSDGTDTMINQSGCSALATGGSGDVLSGIIAGLLAQKMPPFEAAALGVYLHGLAGDAAAARLSAYSVMARDVLEAIPEVLRGIKN